MAAGFLEINSKISVGVTYLKGSCVFLAHHCILASRPSPTCCRFFSLLYLQHTLFSELHFCRPAGCLQGLWTPAGLPRKQHDTTDSWHTRLTPSLLFSPGAKWAARYSWGHPEKKKKKKVGEMKAQNFNTPRQSGSLVLSDKMHPWEALLQQTRLRCVMTTASSLILCTCGLSLMSWILSCNLDWTTHSNTVVCTHHWANGLILWNGLSY